MAEYIDNLKSLHTILIDSKNGYEEALKDAEGRGLTELFSNMIALRERDSAEIAGLLATLGEKADDKGSFMTTVNRAIISIRSLFGDLDEGILPGLIDGEKRISTYYDSTLETVGSTADRAVLTRQLEKVRSVIADMERQNSLAA